MVRWIASALLFIGLTSTFAASADLDKAALAKARKLGQTGKYAEAVDAYDALAKDATSKEDKLKIALGKADNLVITGELDKAAEVLKPFAEGDAVEPAAAAKLASLEFDRGRWDRAESLANAAVKLDKDHIPARWVLANVRGGVTLRP